MEAKVALGEFIRGELAAGNGDGAIDPDADLLELGVLDSAGIAQLIAFCEETFGIAIADDELVPENFESINSIAELVSGKLASRV
jgi:acyl carrier protein